MNARVEAVRQVVEAINDADDAERRWKDATAAHDRAWRAALDAGWSEKDLRATGARAPGQTNRPRRTRTASTRSSTGASSASSEEQPSALIFSTAPVTLRADGGRCVGQLRCLSACG